LLGKISRAFGFSSSNEDYPQEENVTISKLEKIDPTPDVKPVIQFKEDIP
jgi:hypothetical protein